MKRLHQIPPLTVHVEEEAQKIVRVRNEEIKETRFLKHSRHQCTYKLRDCDSKQTACLVLFRVVYQQQKLIVSSGIPQEIETTPKGKPYAQQ